MDDSDGEQESNQLVGQFIPRKPVSEQSDSQGMQLEQPESSNCNMMLATSLENHAAANSEPTSPKPSERPEQTPKDLLMLHKIRKYWLKKHLRCTQKKVRYNCR